MNNKKEYPQSILKSIKFICDKYENKFYGNIILKFENGCPTHIDESKKYRITDLLNIDNL